MQKKLEEKKRTYSSNSEAQDIKNKQDFYSLFTSAVRQLFSYIGLTTDIYRQNITACPLLPAATIRRVLLANSAINFI